jgi:DNA-binding MarR family transcriptional regulator
MSLAKPARLDELLNYRLARLLAVSSAPGIRLLEGGYGIARREWSLVAIVAVHGPISPSDLAEVAHLDRPDVSRAITHLVANGLLARKRVPHDARRAQIAITEAGRRLHDQVFPQLVRINAPLLRALTTEQLAALDGALRILTGTAEDLVRQNTIPLKAARHLGRRREVAAR